MRLTDEKRARKAFEESLEDYDEEESIHLDDTPKDKAGATEKSKDDA